MPTPVAICKFSYEIHEPVTTPCQVQNPIQVYDEVWLPHARKNNLIYEEIFPHMPSNEITTLEERARTLTLALNLNLNLMGS